MLNQRGCPTTGSLTVEQQHLEGCPDRRDTHTATLPNRIVHPTDDTEVNRLPDEAKDTPPAESVNPQPDCAEAVPTSNQRGCPTTGSPGTAQQHPHSPPIPTDKLDASVQEASAQSMDGVVVSLPTDELEAGPPSKRLTSLPDALTPTW